MTFITGDLVDSGNENMWYAGGEYITDEAQTEIAGIIPLTETADFGTVTVVDVDGVETAQCLEFQADGTTPATQASGTDKVQTSAAGVAEVYANYVSIDTPLIEVAASKDVSFKMAAAEFSEPVQGQIEEVQKTGTIKYDMSLSRMNCNSDFVSLILGSKTDDSPNASWEKHHTRTSGINKIGTLVGNRYVDGVLVAKYICLGCSVKSLSEDYPASGFSAESYDLIVDSKMKINLK